MFWFVLGACILPVWLFPYFVTQDGPSHLESANILRVYAWTPLFQQYFRVNMAPVPNWFGHLAEAALVGVLPPAVAEKVFVSAYVAGFGLALRLLTGEVGALLALPLALNCTLLYGFFNFCWSTVWLLLFTALYKRAKLLALALLLLVMYFSHVFGCVVAGMVALVMNWRRVTVFAPVAVLIGWFMMYGGVGAGAGAPVGFLARWNALCHGSTMAFSYAASDQWLSTVYAVMLCGSAVWCVVKRRFNAWSIVAGVLLIASFISPPQAGFGGYVLERIQVCLLLAVALWVTGCSGVGVRWLGAAGALMSIAVAWKIATIEREVNAELAEYMSVASGIEPGRTILPVQFNSRGPGRLQGLYGLPMRHVAGYVALRRGGLDLSNYEGRTGLFPLIFRDEVNPGVHIGGLEDEPPSPTYVDYHRRTPGSVDYVLVWDPLGTGSWKPGLTRLVGVSPKGWARLYRVD